MNLHDVSLSIYSFGYSAGFLSDDRPDAGAQDLTPEGIVELALKYGLGGVEFPLDRYFAHDDDARADAFIRTLRKNGLRGVIDLERFDPEYLRSLLPRLQEWDLAFARVKVSEFFGGNRHRQPGFARDVRVFVEQLGELVPALRMHGVRLLIENHQDVGADDLVRIIGETAADCVGINWDMGNSLPVPETPESFLAKTAGFIGNRNRRGDDCTRAFNRGSSICQS